MEHKRIKRNYYKNSHAKRRPQLLRRITLCFKIMAAITFVMMMSIIFVLGYDFFTQCDYFMASIIEVKGYKSLSKEEVIEQSQINIGQNILSINLSTARKRLLSHSWISEAEVRRELPNSIYIGIKEHEPLAILDIGRKFIINAHGTVFKEWKPSDPNNLPIINGLDFSDLNVPDGEFRSIPFEAVMNVLQLGRNPESILYNRLIKKIHVDREIGLTLYAFNPIKAIKIGYDNYPGKYDRLKSVFLYLKNKQNFLGFNSIDLINLNRIVLNPVHIERSLKNVSGF